MKTILGIGLALAVVSASAIKLAWDPNPEKDISHYNVYASPNNGVNWSTNKVGNVTNYTTNMTGAVGAIFRFYVTAVNSNLMESLPSNTVLWTNLNTPPAFTVSRVTVGGKVGTIWNNVAVEFATINLADYGATSYTIVATPDAGGTPYKVAVSGSPGIIPVLPVADYSIGVIVTNAIGQSPAGVTYALSSKLPTSPKNVNVSVGP